MVTIGEVRVAQSESHSPEENIRCVQGANEQNLPIAGRTVGWARTNLSHALNIAPVATAFVAGLRVDEGRVLEGGQCLEFVLVIGRKGLGEVFTRESLIERMGMTSADFEDMLEAGLPMHRMRDGSIRITETELDRFLELRSGMNPSPGGKDPARPSGTPTVSSPRDSPSPQSFVEKIEQRLAAIQDTISTLLQQRTVKDYYTTEEVAKLVDRDAYTVREWCRYGRLWAVKRPCGRGNSPEWSISHEELVRYQNEGLLPLRK
jgi:Helix-turn-helix domain